MNIITAYTQPSRIKFTYIKTKNGIKVETLTGNKEISRWKTQIKEHTEN